jgi:hypothetical protein
VVKQGMVPANWRLVGKDGELALYQSPGSESGMLVDELTGQVLGEPQPLQVFFKWGNFAEVVTNVSAG